MDADRKKAMVLIALFVVMAGVGAFQLIPKAPPAPPKSSAPVNPAFAAKMAAAQSPSGAGASGTSGSGASGTASAAVRTAGITAGAMGTGTQTPGTTAPLTTAPLSTAPLTTGPLTAGAGATTGGTPTATGTTTGAGADSNAAQQTDPSEPPLPERDPFEAPPDADAKPSQKPAITPAGRTSVASNGPSSPIKEISGSLSPVILPSTLEKDGAMIGGKGGKPVAAEPTFGWKLIGVMSGEHPLVVLADAAGNQRLIRAGSSIDPDSKLISVARDSATVLFRSKKLRLTLVGDQNAK